MSGGGDIAPRGAALFLGDAREVAEVLRPAVAIVRAHPDDVDAERGPFVLAVLDARSYALGALARARRTPLLAGVPTLLVAERDELLADAVEADEVVQPPFDRADARRVRTLAELGRARLVIAGGVTEVERPSLRTFAARRRAFDQSILDGVDVGIVTTDAGGAVTFVNRAAREILALHTPLDGTDVRALLALRSHPETFLDRRPDRLRTRTIPVADGEIEIDLTVSRMEDMTTGDPGFFFVFHDRTQEKKLEVERRRFERLAAMGTMVAGFAHEVRNPMASLRSLAESLNEELTEANLHLPHAHRMLQVLERVERLVRTSLAFGRPSPPRPAAHAPWSLLSAAVSALTARTRELGGELNVETELDLPDVYVDEGQLVQALVIFLNNALDATGSPRRVLLRAAIARPSAELRARASEPPPRFVRFDVKDDGRGIPPDVLGRIFDPFFTTKSTGTGLGLSIAQQIATENGARIEVASAVGGPTVFSLLVPMASAADVAPLSRR